MRVGKGDFRGQSKHVCKGPEAEWDLMHQETDPTDLGKRKIGEREVRPCRSFKDSVLILWLTELT